MGDIGKEKEVGEGLRGDHNLHNFLQEWRRIKKKKTQLQFGGKGSDTMETRAPSLRRLITEPCAGIISHQAIVEGVTWCGSGSVSTPAVVEKQPTNLQLRELTHSAHHAVCNMT